MSTGAIFATYYLRHIPLPLWSRVRAAAKQEGQPTSRVIVRLLSQYASGCEATKSREPDRM